MLAWNHQNPVPAKAAYKKRVRSEKYTRKDYNLHRYSIGKTDAQRLSLPSTYSRSGFFMPGSGQRMRLVRVRHRTPLRPHVRALLWRKTSKLCTGAHEGPPRATRVKNPHTGCGWWRGNIIILSPPKPRTRRAFYREITRATTESALDLFSLRLLYAGV